MLTAKKIIIHFLKKNDTRSGETARQDKLQGGTSLVDHIILENMNIKETLNKKYPQPCIS